MLLVQYGGLQRNQARELCREQIDLVAGIQSVSETKNGKPHIPLITPLMRELFERRGDGLQRGDELFGGVAAGQLSKMVARVGLPAFKLHGLRRLVATEGRRLDVGDAVLRSSLNHTAQRSNLLHRHDVLIGG